jgi:hypothetical protein
LCRTISSAFAAHERRHATEIAAFARRNLPSFVCFVCFVVPCRSAGGATADAFAQRKQELLQSNEGKFVVIHQANGRVLWAFARAAVDDGPRSQAEVLEGQPEVAAGDVGQRDVGRAALGLTRVAVNG